MEAFRAEKAASPTAGWYSDLVDKLYTLLLVDPGTGPTFGTSFTSLATNSGVLHTRCSTLDVYLWCR